MNECQEQYLAATDAYARAKRKHQAAIRAQAEAKSAYERAQAHVSHTSRVSEDAYQAMVTARNGYENKVEDV